MVKFQGTWVGGPGRGGPAKSTSKPTEARKQLLLGSIHSSNRGAKTLLSMPRVGAVRPAVGRSMGASATGSWSHKFQQAF